MSDPTKGGGGKEPPREDAAQAIDAELESLGAVLDGAFGEALGDLLGAPMPLPAPPEDQVLPSAPRPAGAPSPPAPRAPTPPPIVDEDPFDVSGSAEFDAAFARSADPVTPRPGRADFSEKTRIAAVDDRLLRE